MGHTIAGMAHSYNCNWQHIVFSTKDRIPVLNPELRPELWRYMAGIAKNHDMRPYAINGWKDHAHCLVNLPATMDNATAARILKANSSRWVKGKVKGFAWQIGYAAFSVSASNVEKVAAYIRNQEQHHARWTYEEELIALLTKHGVKFDPNEVFG